MLSVSALISYAVFDGLLSKRRYIFLTLRLALIHKCQSTVWRNFFSKDGPT